MNIFIGKNAQGKTNLLESIYLCATGSSFRTSRDSELINFYKRQAYVGVNINHKNGKKLVEIKLDRDKPKRVKINRIELDSLRELNNDLNVVVFSPEDLKIVKGGPVERRNFLDHAISQIRPVYKYNLGRYNKILYQRNNLLKSPKPKEEIMKLIEIFDIQMAKVGTDIILSRKEFLNVLSNYASLIHKNLTLKHEDLYLKYTSNINFKSNSRKEIENLFLEQLSHTIQKDLVTGNTGIGPHRDDIEIKLNNINSRIFGSQGQQRTVVLSIKLAQVELINMERGDYPVLLLDDVFSELDEQRREYLSRSFNKMQTVITSTDLLGLEGLKEIEQSIFYIEDGKILYKE